MARFEELRGYGWQLKWVRPENWHLTMKFLGNVPSAAVPHLEESVRAQVAAHSPFRIALGGLGGFPRLSRARVLWVGVREGKEPLVELSKAVHDGCTDAGYPGDKKPFEPHFTLARAKKDPVAIKVPDCVFTAHWGERFVESVSLVRSTLQPSGAVYETLAEIPM
jgi:2'-5' RNA ligase